MPKLISAKPLDGFRLQLRYTDGTEGVADLSNLVGQGVFACWDEPGCFETARVTDFGAVAWSDDVDLCPDTLYLQITGKSVEEMMPGVAALTDIA